MGRMGWVSRAIIRSLTTGGFVIVTYQTFSSPADFGVILRGRFNP